MTRPAGTVVSGLKKFGNELVGGGATLPYKSELAEKMQEYMLSCEDILRSSDGLSVNTNLYEKLKELLVDLATGGHVADDIKETCTCIQHHVHTASASQVLLICQSCNRN